MVRRYDWGKSAAMLSLLLLSLALAEACVREAVEPAPSAPAELSPQAEAEPETETPEARTARLNRAADIAAGIDPDQPLPKWTMPSRTANVVPSKPSCEVGVQGVLRVEGVGVTGRSESYEVLLGGGAAISTKHGRETLQRVVSLGRLVPDPQRALEVVSCEGTVLAIPAGSAAADAAWVLTENKRGMLKLMDWREGQDGRQPAARNVTMLRQL